MSLHVLIVNRIRSHDSNIHCITNSAECSFFIFMMSLSIIRWDNAPTAVNAYYDPNFNQFGTFVSLLKYMY